MYKEVNKRTEKENIEKATNYKFAQTGKVIIILSVFALIASSCGQLTNKQTDTITNEIVVEQEEPEIISNEPVENKFLITNNSVGYFNIGASWQNIAEKEYHYEYVQGYGTCIDACCNGGFDLGNDIITIGTLCFEKSDIFDDDSDKYKSNTNLFYVISENCRGWYWKDKIRFIEVHSDLFKIKEGVGVGTTLKDAQKKLGKLSFTIGWVTEDRNAVYFSTSSYPNVEFIIDADDYVDGWEELDNLFFAGEEYNLTISDFKNNTKIKRIIVREKQINK